MAIGWGKIGEIGAPKLGGEEQIKTAIQKKYPELSNSKSGGFSLWNFYATMQIGDLVILRGTGSSRVVEVTGDYLFDLHNTPLLNDYNHQRPVEFTNIDPDRLWNRAGRMARDGGNIYRALIRCERQLSPADLQPLCKPRNR